MSEDPTEESPPGEVVSGDGQSTPESSQSDAEGHHDEDDALLAHIRETVASRYWGPFPAEIPVVPERIDPRAPFALPFVQYQG